ncbi:MAG: hypothetical protein R2942_13355 [Ignavibacteria bacterium]
MILRYLDKTILCLNEMIRAITSGIRKIKKDHIFFSAEERSFI